MIFIFIFFTLPGIFLGFWEQQTSSLQCKVNKQIPLPVNYLKYLNYLFFQFCTCKISEIVSENETELVLMIYIWLKICLTGVILWTVTSGSDQNDAVLYVHVHGLFFLFVAADWTKLQTFMYFFFKPGNACVVRRFSFLNFVL